MRGEEGHDPGVRRTTMRSTAAALIVVAASLLGLVRSSSAVPSRQDVDRARTRLEALNADLAALEERSNLARIRLQEVETRLVQTRAEAARAKAEAAEAVASLNEAAGRAYVGFQSEISVLFDATSFADFSDRIEFLGRLAQADADAATEASRAQQEARWLAGELARRLEERRDAVEEIERLEEAIRRRIASARATLEDLSAAYEASLAAIEAQEPPPTSVVGVAAPVPAVGGGAEIAIAAARSVIGAPYVFGAADPAVGFDCSGLTMWAWAQAGVSLPHSSTLQHASLPHVDRSDLRPGDLVFFSFGRLGPGVIDDVGLYIGGGQMIASQNPSTGVALGPVDWPWYVAAARPG